MTASSAPDPAAPTTLVDVLIALRTVMAEERRAIARLDLEALEALTARKHGVAEQLAALLAAGHAPTAGEARAITAARHDLAASSSLLGTARAAVASVLGIEPDDRYDRMARTHARMGPLRAVAY